LSIIACAKYSHATVIYSSTNVGLAHVRPTITITGLLKLKRTS